MTRWRAAGIHLLLSALLGVCVLALLFFVWYPGPLFRATGGEKLLLLIVGIDIVAGPLLTLCVYDAKKRLMKLDLAVIGVIQICFLVYGLTTMTVARPAYIAFVQDRFVVMPANGLSPEDQANASDPRYQSVGWTGPEWVFVERPVDPEEKLEAFNSAMGGKDLEYFPKFYRPYEGHAEDVIRRGWPLTLLQGQNPVWDEWIGALEQRYGADQIVFLPLKAKLAEMAVIVDKQSAKPLEYLEINPWPAILTELAKRAEAETAAAADSEEPQGSDSAGAAPMGDGEMAVPEADSDEESDPQV